MTTTLPLPDQLIQRSATTEHAGIKHAETGHIETFYADGRWHSRRHDSDEPFASGDDELQQIALGSQVARWNRLPHIIRSANGTITETIPAP